MSDSFSILSSSDSERTKSNSVSFSRSSTAFDELSLDSVKCMDDVKRIKDMDVTSSEGEITYQRVMSYMSSTISDRETINIFNLVYKCEKYTYGGKILSVLVDKNLKNITGINITRIQSDIYITDPLTKSQLEVMYKSLSIDMSKHKGKRVLIVYCSTHITRNKVQLFLKKHFKGYDVYYYIVDRKIIARYGRDVTVEDSLRTSDVSESFSRQYDSPDIILHRNSSNGIVIGALVFFIIIILLLALFASSISE